MRLLAALTINLGSQRNDLLGSFAPCNFSMLRVRALADRAWGRHARGRHMMGPRVLSLVALTLVVAASACASDDDGSASSGAAASSAGAGTGSANPDEQCPANYLPFSTGEEAGLRVPVEGTNMEVRLLTADHEPPARDWNTWTIGIRDAATGAPATTPVITWACAWMDVHGHGTNPKQVEKVGDADYQLASQNLSMFGPWEIRLWIDPTGTEMPYAPGSGSTERNGNACMPTHGMQGTANTEFTICVPRSVSD